MDSPEGSTRIIFDLSSNKSFFDLNRSNQQTVYLNVVENAIDSLETAVAFLSRPDSLKWKWIAIALHHALYSFCVASLESGNYDNVLSSAWDEDSHHYCKFGENVKWKKSSKVKRSHSKGYTIEWNDTNEDPEHSLGKKKKKGQKSKHKLIDFWTALARVQDQYFWMGRMYNKKALKLTEKEWESTELLTSEFRNGYVHFVPITLSVPIEIIKEACLDVLKMIEFLAFESHTIIYTDYQQDHERIKNALKKFRTQVAA